MDKRFLLILAAVVVVFGGIFWFSKAKTHKANSNTSTSSKASNHVEGNNTTGVTLVEYGDYQCPACGQYFPIVKQLQDQFKDKIAFRFANFPLVQIHQNAMVGARAAEAAALQGKFWEMHDILYEQQQTWSTASDPTSFFVQYATSLGLDVNKFKTDMASQAVLDTINADVAQAQAAGGTGTPTFVLNGKRLDPNPNSLEAFTQTINDAIKNAKQ